MCPSLWLRLLLQALAIPSPERWHSCCAWMGICGSASGPEQGPGPGWAGCWQGEVAGSTAALFERVMSSWCRRWQEVSEAACCAQSLGAVFLSGGRGFKSLPQAAWGEGDKDGCSPAPRGVQDPQHQSFPGAGQERFPVLLGSRVGNPATGQGRDLQRVGTGTGAHHLACSRAQPLELAWAAGTAGCG